MKSKSLDLSNTYVTKVQRIDSFGQGVCEIDGHLVFVPKTLTSEVIKIKLIEKKKGVYFGTLLDILEASKLRESSECTHFDTCNGCNYLHISYQEELTLKLSALKQALSYLSFKNFQAQLIQPKQRFGYRNRIQLHYRTKPIAQLGFLNSNSILPINECLLPREEIRKFYSNFKLNWQDHLPKNAPASGHIEIYFHDNSLSVAWNSNYSHLGFTQVNDEANQLLKNTLSSYFTQSRKVLELFCGNGNLLKNVRHELTINGFDTFGNLPTPHVFTQANLFETSGIAKVLNVTQKLKFQDLVVDPPRSGFKELSSIAVASECERLFYVSCWPSTMVRDLEKLFLARPWTQMKVYLIDMFPGTKHFETLCIASW